MGVFSAKSSPDMDTKRNSFPLSFSNNLTMQFGKIYPVFVKSCDPGDSFNIKASFGLNFLPTVYPVQTPMKAYLHFFYCRNRTVWTDFMNFYTMKDRAGQNISTSTYVPPYLDFSKQKLGASELVDYMGIPVPESLGNVPSEEFVLTNVEIPLCSNSNSYAVAPAISYNKTSTFNNLSDNLSFNSGSSEDETEFRCLPLIFSVGGTIFEGKTLQNLKDEYSLNPDRVSSFTFDSLLLQGTPTRPLTDKGLTRALVGEANSVLSDIVPSDFFIMLYDSNGANIGSMSITPEPSSISFSLQYDDSSMGSLAYSVSFRGPIDFSPSTPLSREVSYISCPFFIGRNPTALNTPNAWEKFVLNMYSATSWSERPNPLFSSIPLYTGSTTSSTYLRPVTTRFSFNWNSSMQTYSDSALNSPYYDSVNFPEGLKINSLPFRHYEAIYNYFYRDNRNNPLRDTNGNPVYNEVLLPSQLSGGAETTGYDFHYRNWEQDFLTTCVQEPQLGQAPLVGISSTGVASFKNDDGTTTNVQLRVAEDGDTIEGFDTSEGVSAPVAHSLVELATQGISISDFRNVNAFQTWLEIQMRKTLRFGDSIQGHFNVNPKYDDYLYPEFIGGVTQEVDTYQVNQTSPSADSPLGAYAGQAICKGNVPRAISKFCDEPGYIIGLLSIVPQPVYSQILPKHYLRRETLDYHFPEFNNISYQPVTYAEVCPVLAFNENKSLDSVFGYQRPWYDLISSLDEAHGQFLTTLNGFILSRRFVSYPSLGERFLTVHPEDLNDIFSTKMTDSNDVILGQLYFDVVKKTQISKFGIPSLQIG